jgi:hypothetical protein
MIDFDKALTELGLPTRDASELPTSGKTFADGGHYRLEVSGIERFSAMQTMVETADQLGVAIHRGIVSVGGATTLSFAELQESYHQKLIHEKVRFAAITHELIQRQNSQLKPSPAGSSDLVVPRP